MRKLAIFSCGAAAAVAAYVWLLQPLLALAVGIFLAVVGGATAFFHCDNAKRIRIFAIGGICGLLLSWNHERTRILPLQQLCGEARQITVEVCDLPEETNYGCRVICRVNRGKILLYLNTEASAISLGDTLCLCADVSSASQHESLYYQSRDISLIGIQQSELVIEKSEKLPLRYYPKAMIRELRAMIYRIFSADTANFMNALITGDTDGLSYETRNQMSVVGVSHVVCVSGMHISILSGAVSVLCFRRRKLAAAVSFGVMFLFVAMLGFTPSAMRAFLMQSVFLAAPLCNRENDAPTSLAFSLFVLLAINPWSIANISLQLSYAAMTGITLFGAPLYRWQMKLPVVKRILKRSRAPGRLFRTVARLNATSLGAAVLTTPLVARYFGTVSLVALPVNLLTSSVLSGCFCFGCGAILIGFFLKPFAVGAAWLISWAVRYALWVFDAMSTLPYAAVYTDSVYITAWLVAVYLMIAAILLAKRKEPTTFALSMALSLLCAVGFSASSPAEISVTVEDVGQGQAVLIQSRGFHAMVDCGGDSGDADGEHVARQLLMHGVDTLDLLVLTHYDTDHVCGMAQLLSRVEVRQLIAPDTFDDADNRSAVLELANAYQIPVLLVSDADLKVEFPEGTMRIFAPMSGKDDNAGISALMSSGEYDILITGDMDAAGEKRLLDTHTLPDIEVLVAGHHGSKYSTSPRLLQTLQPETVVISVGRNSYGHPTQEVLDRIAAIGAAVYRTDTDGDITILR